MRILFGPVESLGHPFHPHPAELLKEREIGKHDVTCFSLATLETPNWWDSVSNIDAVVIWDPMWRTVEALTKPLALATALDAPKVGIFGDWSAGWYSRFEHAGVQRSLPMFDAVLTCRAGKVALAPGFNGPIIATPNLLTYGRMIDRGDPLTGDDLVREWPSHEEREIDVCFVGHKQSNSVPLRPYMLEQLEQICARNGWSLTNAMMPWDLLEGELLRSKVCFNWSLGTTLNCRVYEAAAAGCTLVTDYHCIDNGQINSWARFYANEAQLEVQLEWLLRRDFTSMRTGLAWEATRWAIEHSPYRTWKRNFDAIEEALQAL